MATDGWIRRIYGSGNYQIAWYKDGKYHGYCKRIKSDGSVDTEALWENGKFRCGDSDVNQWTKSKHSYFI